MFDPLASGRRSAAIFVDFDNVYSALKTLREDAAHEFATNPLAWLEWLSRVDVESGGTLASAPVRRFLFRSAYINPRAYSQFRADFSRAAFRVVDCPPLTRQGKTSTDIHLVMDVLDTLAHPTRFEDFVLLSADADFTPLLMRLRAFDRRTLVISVGPSASAYRNAADLLVTEDAFIQQALRLTTASGTLGPQTEADLATEAESLVDLSKRLAEAAAARGPLPAGDLPRVYTQSQAFRESNNWLGFWSLRALTEQLVELSGGELSLTGEDDRWAVTPAAPAPVEAAPSPDVIDLRQRISDQVRRLLTQALQPVPMVDAAQSIQRALGSTVTESHWAGYGSFRRFLENSGIPGLRLIQRSTTDWVLADEERHDLGAIAAPDSGNSSDRLRQRLARLTGLPPLSGSQYAILFDALSGLLAHTPYELTLTSKLLRDRCAERSLPIPRAAASFVVRGLELHGDLQRGATYQVSADVLAHAFVEQVRFLCEDAQLELTPEDQVELERWLTQG